MKKRLQYVLILAFAWAMTIFLNKFALEVGAIPFGILFQGNIITIVIAGSIVLYRKDPIKKMLKYKKRFLIMGLSVGVAYITSIIGLSLTQSINYAFLIKSSLIWTMVLAFILLKERFTKQKIALMIIFITGAYLITTGGKLIVPQIGDLLILCTSFLYSLAAVIQKPVAKKFSASSLAFVRLAIGTVIVTAVGLYLGKEMFSIHAPFIIILIGIFGAMTLIYLSKVLSVASAGYMTMMTMLVPVINTALGALFLGEIMNMAQVVGGILIIGSGIAVQKFKI